MTISGRDRAELRAEAHHLTALVHVGQHGMSPTVIQALDDALRTRELVKVQLGRNTDVKARDAAATLAAETGAIVIQVIGKTATLYRENPELPRKPRIVVATKMDAADPAKVRKLQQWCRQRRIELIKISSVTGEGLEELKHGIIRKLSSETPGES